MLSDGRRCQFIGIGPVLPVSDVQATVDYYCRQLGFVLDFVMGEPPDHGSVTRGKVGIQFAPCADPQVALFYPGYFYLFVENIDVLAAEYRDRGIAFSQALQTQDHGMREFEVVDLNGFRLRYGAYV